MSGVSGLEGRRATPDQIQICDHQEIDLALQVDALALSPHIPKAGRYQTSTISIVEVVILTFGSQFITLFSRLILLVSGAYWGTCMPYFIIRYVIFVQVCYFTAAV